MKVNLKRALSLFLTCYVIVTILASAISIIYAIIYKTPAPPPGITVLKSASFVATVPYHVLLMLIVWPFFAWIYFRRSGNATTSAEAWQISFLWLLSAIVLDFVGFVLIRHPYSLTPHEFYIDYQPWITLIYCAIFLSPWVYIKVFKVVLAK